MARRRIRMADFRGEPLELELPDGNVYQIRGDLPMEVVNYLAEFEERGTEAEGQGADDFDRWLEEGRALLEKLIREGHPDQREVVMPSLSPQELLGTMGAMVGGESVGAALAVAMNEGVGRAMRESAERRAAERAEEAAGQDPPTRTRKRTTTTTKRARRPAPAKP